MKKVMLTMVISSILVTGCQNDDVKVLDAGDQTNDASQIEVKTDEDEASNLIDVENIDDLFLNESVDADDTKELIDFIDRCKSKYSKTTMDLLVDRLLNTLESKSIEEYDERAYGFLKIFEEEERILSFDSYNTLLDENNDFKVFVEELSSNGFKINYSVYWSPFVDIAYETVFKKFGDYVTDEHNAYLSILSRESSHHYIGTSFDDLSRAISLDELVSRILLTESFMDVYPESSKLEIVKKFNTEYMFEYFYGHTKYYTSFDWMEDFTLYEEFEEHYKKSLEEFAGTVLSDKINEFLEVINANEGVVDVQNPIVDGEDYILTNHIWIEYR